jgi:hypothetical protein
MKILTVKAIETVSSLPCATNAMKEKTETRIGAQAQRKENIIVFHLSVH